MDGVEWEREEHANAGMEENLENSFFAGDDSVDDKLNIAESSGKSKNQIHKFGHSEVFHLRHQIIMVLEEIKLRKECEDRNDAKIKDLLSQVYELEKAKDSLEHQLKQEESRFSTAMARVKQAKEEQEHKAAKYHHKTSKSSNDEKTNDALKAEARKLQLLNYQQENTIKSLEAKLNSQTSTAQQAMGQITGLKDKVSTVTKLYQDTNSYLTSLEATVHESKTLTSTLDHAYRHQKCLLKVKSEEIQLLKKSLLESKVSLRSFGVTGRGSHEEDGDDGNRWKVERLQRRVKELETCNEDLEKELSFNNDKTQEALKRAQTAHVLVSRHLASANKSKDELDQLHVQCDKLGGQCRRLEDDLEENEKKLGELRKDFGQQQNQWKKESSMLTIQVQDLQARLVVETDHKVRLEEDNSQLTRHNQQLYQSMEEVMTKLGTTRSEACTQTVASMLSMTDFESQTSPQLTSILTQTLDVITESNGSQTVNMDFTSTHTQTNKKYFVLKSTDPVVKHYHQLQGNNNQNFVPNNHLQVKSVFDITNVPEQLTHPSRDELYYLDKTTTRLDAFQPQVMSSEYSSFNHFENRIQQGDFNPNPTLADKKDPTVQLKSYPYCNTTTWMAHGHSMAKTSHNHDVSLCSKHADSIPTFHVSDANEHLTNQAGNVNNGDHDKENGVFCHTVDVEDQNQPQCKAFEPDGVSNDFMYFSPFLSKVASSSSLSLSSSSLSSSLSLRRRVKSGLSTSITATKAPSPNQGNAAHCVNSTTHLGDSSSCAKNTSSLCVAITAKNTMCSTVINPPDVTLPARDDPTWNHTPITHNSLKAMNTSPASYNKFNSQYKLLYGNEIIAATTSGENKTILATTSGENKTTATTTAATTTGENKTISATTSGENKITAAAAATTSGENKTTATTTSIANETSMSLNVDSIVAISKSISNLYQPSFSHPSLVSSFQYKQNQMKNQSFKNSAMLTPMSSRPDLSSTNGLENNTNSSLLSSLSLLHTQSATSLLSLPSSSSSSSLSSFLNLMTSPIPLSLSLNLQSAPKMLSSSFSSSSSSSSEFTKSNPTTFDKTSSQTTTPPVPAMTKVIRKIHTNNDKKKRHYQKRVLFTPVSDTFITGGNNTKCDGSQGWDSQEMEKEKISLSKPSGNVNNVESGDKTGGDDNNSGRGITLCQRDSKQLNGILKAPSKRKSCGDVITKSVTFSSQIDSQPKNMVENPKRSSGNSLWSVVGHDHTNTNNTGLGAETTDSVKDTTTTYISTCSNFDGKQRDVVTVIPDSPEGSCSVHSGNSIVNTDHGRNNVMEMSVDSGLDGVDTDMIHI